MLQKIYEQMADFYRNIEEEYGTVFGDNFDWEHFHFKFLIYYLDMVLGVVGILLFTIIVLLIVCILKR